MRQLAFADQNVRRPIYTTPLGAKRGGGGRETPPNVTKVAKRFRIVGAFNEFARSKDEISQSAYDEHMGSVTNHYEVMKKILRTYERRGLFFTRDATLKSLRIIDVGCGTGELIAYLLREFYLKLIREIDLKLTIVLADPAQNMLEIAMRKLEGIGMQIDRGNGKLTVLSILQYADQLVIPAGQGDNFDIAMYTYVAPWFADGNSRQRSYARGRSLIREGGRLVSLEESPLVITPSRSLPENFERTLAECADPISPRDLRKLLERLNFELIEGTDVVFEIDQHHSMYGRVYTVV